MTPIIDKKQDKGWIVVDLDGTLCDCAHRVHLAQAKQWEEFHSLIPLDKVNETVACVCEIFWEDFDLLLCSGRNESTRAATLEWLKQKDLLHNFAHLLLRPDNDYSPDHELKIAMVEDFFGGHQKAIDNVFLILDDRDKVVEAWRNAGYDCWQVAAGSY